MAPLNGAPNFSSSFCQEEEIGGFTGEEKIVPWESNACNYVRKREKNRIDDRWEEERMEETSTDDGL